MAGSILKAIIQRSPTGDSLPRKLVGSKQCVAVDEFIVFDRCACIHSSTCIGLTDYFRDHPIFMHQPISRCTREWDAKNSPSLLEIATAAKTVSEAGARYQLYKRQCIWYALTVFNLVAQVFHEGGCPVRFIRLTELTLSILLKRSNFTQLSAVLRQNLQKCPARVGPTTTFPSPYSFAGLAGSSSTSHPSTAHSSGAVKSITTYYPSTAFPAEGVPIASVLPTDTATELGSIISFPSTYESSGVDTTTAMQLSCHADCA